MENKAWWYKQDGSYPTEEEQQQPVKIASYGTGERAAAIWAFGDLLVFAGIRVHGHGEMGMTIQKVGMEEPEDLMSEMNVNFGRTVDKMLQQQMYEGITPLGMELAQFLGIKIDSDDAALEFPQRVLEIMLDGLDINNDKFEIFVGVHTDKDEFGMLVQRAIIELNLKFINEYIYNEQILGPAINKYVKTYIWDPKEEV